MKYSVIVNGKKLSVEIVGEAVKIDGRPVTAEFTHGAGGQPSLLSIGGTQHRVAFEKTVAPAGQGTVRRGQYSIWVDGEKFVVDAMDERRRAIEEATASTAVHRVADLKAPMPGLIVNVRIAVGESVVAGQGLIVMEAMKMENELRATSAGTVTKVHVAQGKVVEKGAILVEFE